MNSKNFYQWLLSQTNRDNLVGDIALHIKRDNNIHENMTFEEIRQAICSSVIGYFRIEKLADWGKEGRVHPKVCLELAHREFSLYREKHELKKYVLPSLDGYVYFLRDSKIPDEIKIGRARDVKKRVSSFNTGRPRDLLVIRKIYSGNYKNLEKKIHAHFKNKNIKREWFRIEEEALEYFFDNFNELIE